MPSRTVRISTENHAFQHLDALRRKRETRHRHRQFFVEGVRPIDQALAHGWPVEAFAYARDRRLSDWARDILARSPARTHYEVAPALFDKLSGKAEPSELLAIVAMPDDDLARIPLAADLLVVVCDRPASPGNLGTTLRSCDAFGAHGLIVAGHATDLYAPETVAATTGSLFALPAVRVA
ncbi:MAG TPA: TrmH family RNA methyltransferase, partial [Thermomicrobiales bacterium]|nr:TrmH family RNA methyltransferase [Thermomicrobiales bacterium]